ncbi:type II secretion system minor pseudopilin GspI [Enterovibrio nigricans]|uniref:Type II secretion system protein I n=1 Tax=Enterovibrio nigricans DSM 22720 TaxID=1121868 RepID=A0A1T4UA32_9GAMM|nr:type II secretion system minor pseudopilin GspI [Enterovibrio nigricans]PKF51402.1 type II secretion system protein GspI [Enterovibrio nigricans]SKA49553.1 general secretion pathway protein I [Enterovibrio nigricans DSM 22720]
MRTSRGFTLIEVLVAMAVFAISALAVMNVSSQQVNNLSALEEKTFAAMVADNQLALLMLENKVPTSAKSGKSEMAGREWYWTIKPIATAQSTLRAVDILVWQDERKQSALATVRTYVPAN